MLWGNKMAPEQRADVHMADDVMKLRFMWSPDGRLKFTCRTFETFPCFLVLLFAPLASFKTNTMTRYFIQPTVRSLIHVILFMGRVNKEDYLLFNES